MIKRNNVIDLQQNIAREVLNKLEIIDPACILAGGAPRDWFFDKPCNDLDFYLYLGDCTVSNLDARLKRLGFKGIKVLGHDDPTYKSLKKLKRVVEFEYLGMRVQVMEMTEPTYGCVIPHFNLDTSKAWWKGHRICTDGAFELAHMFEVFNYKPEELKTPYLVKMAKRYPLYDWVENGNYTDLIAAYAKKHGLVASCWEVTNHWREQTGKGSSTWWGF